VNGTPGFRLLPRLFRPPTLTSLRHRHLACFFRPPRNAQQDVNKRRLGVLLGEVQRGEKGDERWKAALDGRTSGTTSGTSKGVRL
jgi:hypothetical protein